MQQFLDIITHYPVAIFSVLVLVSVIYWLIACLGFIDLDSGVDVDVDLDLDVDVPDVGADIGDGYDVDASGMHGPMAGLLLKATSQNS